MKKVYVLEELECAHCAAKMEEAIRKIEGVEAASISFLAQRLTIEADEARLDAILKQADKAVRRIEPDCRIVR